MSQATAVAFEQAVAPDAFAATRANYERFAFQLLRVGHVPGSELAHLDFRVLLFLLAQKPGCYAAHHRTIAKACDSNATSIKQALRRLRVAGLVLWELIPPHHALPTGRFTRTNVNRYWVHLPRLATLLDAPVAPPPTRRDPTRSTRLNSAASYGTEIRSEQPPPLPPHEEPPSAAPTAAPEEEAVKPIDVSLEIQPIQAAWDLIGLGALDQRSVRALENRLIEGASLEQLGAAVAGAGVDEWLRRRAKSPFAVVFASLASIERFAHQGRKVLAAKDFEARREAEEQRKDREWRARIVAKHQDDCPTADELRASLPPAPSTPPPRPMTEEEAARRRIELIARAEAWARENGETV